MEIYNNDYLMNYIYSFLPIKTEIKYYDELKDTLKRIRYYNDYKIHYKIRNTYFKNEKILNEMSDKYITKKLEVNLDNVEHIVFDLYGDWYYIIHKEYEIFDRVVEYIKNCKIFNCETILYLFFMLFKRELKNDIEIYGEMKIVDMKILRHNNFLIFDFILGEYLNDYLG
jgi:hypothetical protein